MLFAAVRATRLYAAEVKDHQSEYAPFHVHTYTAERPMLGDGGCTCFPDRGIQHFLLLCGRVRGPTPWYETILTVISYDRRDYNYFSSHQGQSCATVSVTYPKFGRFIDVTLPRLALSAIFWCHRRTRRDGTTQAASHEQRVVNLASLGESSTLFAPHCARASSPTPDPSLDTRSLVRSSRKR